MPNLSFFMIPTIIAPIIAPIALFAIPASAAITEDNSTKIAVASAWSADHDLSAIMVYPNPIVSAQTANAPILDLRYHNDTLLDVHTINQQIAALGDGGIVRISGKVSFDDSLIIADNQTLLGQHPIQIKSLSDNKTLHTQTTPALISNRTNDSSVIKVGSNTTIKGVTITGGLAGISSLNTRASNVSIDHVDISNSIGDGIKLDNTDGVRISNSRLHDLYICEDKAVCEFSVISPTIAPNAAISAVGSRNITIDNVAIDGVTYGVFLASDFVNNNDSDISTDQTTTTNVTINNTNIRNSRREGLLLVGNDTVTTNNLTIDNRQQVQNMDLIVLQASRDVTMTNTHLAGGINGVMIVNSATLPNVNGNGNNIVIKDMTISSPSRSGVFINPAARIGLENITINNPKIAGLSLLGNEFGNDGLGAAVENMTLTNVQINHPAKAAIAFSGPIKNISGDVITTQSASLCVNPSNMGQLKQDAGNTLTINGKVLADLEECD